MTAVIDTLTITREAWLQAAVNVFRPRFAELNYPLPAKIHVSVGFGTGVRGENKSVLGATWATWMSTDGVNQVFVSPVLDDPVDVLRVLLHELIHVVLDNADGHKDRFADIAVHLGFVDKMTTATVGEDLKSDLAMISEVLGEYPHRRLSPNTPTPDETAVPHTGPKTQSTRYLKVVCPDGYTVRITKKWANEGLPTCPHGHEMDWA